MTYHGFETVPVWLFVVTSVFATWACVSARRAIGLPLAMVGIVLNAGTIAVFVLAASVLAVCGVEATPSLPTCQSLQSISGSVWANTIGRGVFFIPWACGLVSAAAALLMPRHAMRR